MAITIEIIIIIIDHHNPCSTSVYGGVTYRETGVHDHEAGMSGSTCIPKSAHTFSTM